MIRNIVDIEDIFLFLERWWGKLNKKKVLSIFLAFGLVFSLTVTVFADPNKEDLEKQQTNLQNKANQNKNTANDLDKRIGDMNSQIETLDGQIEKLMIDMQQNNKQIENVQGQIKQTEEKIKKAEADIKEEQDLFDKRMRVMYVKGNASYLEIMLDSKGISDFISKLEAVKKVAGYDKKMIDGLKEKRSVIVTQKAKLDEENGKLQKLKKDNEDKMAKLNATKASQQKMIATLNIEKAKLKTDNAAIAAELAEVNKVLEKIKNPPKPANPGTGTGGSGGTGTGTVTSTNAVIQYALQFQGCKYVWGHRGELGPDGRPTFDCSGFVQYVYRHFGYEVGWTTYDQRNYGKAVSRSELQPGDMIFFGPSYEGIHHVGLYVGDGWFIHAPQTGDVVKLSKLTNRSDYYSARRVIY